MIPDPRSATRRLRDPTPEASMQLLGIRRGVLASTFLVATACAAGGSATAGSPTPDGEAQQQTRRTVITAAEIPEGTTETAYELVQRLHPDFLRTRVGSRSSNRDVPNPPNVFVDGQRIGDISELRRIPASALSLIRSYTMEQAKQKFGMQYEAAALEIVYRR
jgi:hypothetical protein